MAVLRSRRFQVAAPGRPAASLLEPAAGAAAERWMGDRVRQPGHRCTARSRASPGSLPPALPAAPALCERLSVISESRVAPAAVAWGLRPTPVTRDGHGGHGPRPPGSGSGGRAGRSREPPWSVETRSTGRSPVRGRVPLPGACRGAPALGRAGAGRIVGDANDSDTTEACAVGSAHSPVPYIKGYEIGC